MKFSTSQEEEEIIYIYIFIFLRLCGRFDNLLGDLLHLLIGAFGFTRAFLRAKAAGGRAVTRIIDFGLTFSTDRGDWAYHMSPLRQ